MNVLNSYYYLELEREIVVVVVVLVLVAIYNSEFYSSLLFIAYKSNHHPRFYMHK